MKLILIQDVDKLGRMGDVVNVKDGYARNFLIPKGLCIEASNKNVKVLEHERKLIEKKLERQREQAKTLSEKLKAVSVTIPMFALAILLPANSVNHTLLSAPAAMKVGWLPAVGTSYSVMTPAGVTCPILVPDSSANHRAPSGPTVMP